MKIDTKGYGKKYNKRKLFRKISKFGKKMGKSIVENVFILYFCLVDKDTPFKAKAAIIACLGYVISPVDAVPDITPFIGYSDDGSAILATLAFVSMYIKEDHKDKAKEKVEHLFK